MRAWWTAAVLAAVMLVVMTSCGPATPPRPSAAAPAPLALRGVVLDETGAPAPGALVVLDHERTHERTTTTDADGAFVFDDVPPGSRAIYARLDVRWSQALGVVARPGRGAITLRLRRSGVVVLRFVDEAGADVAGVSVETGPMTLAPRADGRFEIARGVRVTARAPGHAAATVRSSNTYDPTARQERTVTLVPGTPLSGTIVDAHGAPVSGAKVWLEVDRPDGLAEQSESDADGRWSFPAVPTTGRAEVRSWVGGRTSMELDLAARAEVVLSVDAKLTMTASGTVVDANGRPGAGAFVHTVDGAVRADARGRFELVGDSYLPQVFAVRGEDASAQVDLSYPPDRDDIRLTLRPAFVRGVVVDAAGAPVAGAQVLAGGHDWMPFDGHSRWDVTDEDGAFVVGPALGDELELAVILPDDPARPPRLSFVTTVRRDDHAARVVLPDAGEVRARVTLDGAPVTRFAIALRPAREHDDDHVRPSPILGTLETVTDGDGALVRADVPAGRWVLGIVGEGFAAWDETITVEPDRTTDLGAVQLQRGRTLRGRVVAEGVPRAGVLVVAGLSTRAELVGGDPLDLARFGIRSTHTDADGTFTLEHLGERRVRVQAHDGTWRSPSVDVRGPDVTLELAPPAAPKTADGAP